MIIWRSFWQKKLPPSKHLWVLRSFHPKFFKSHLDSTKTLTYNLLLKDPLSGSTESQGLAGTVGVVAKGMLTSWYGEYPKKTSKKTGFIGRCSRISAMNSSFITVYHNATMVYHWILVQLRWVWSKPPGSPCVGDTFSPIIMEVENGYIWRVTTIGGTPIFDFHDYGRKCRSHDQLVVFNTTKAPIFCNVEQPSVFNGDRETSRGSSLSFAAWSGFTWWCGDLVGWLVVVAAPTTTTTTPSATPPATTTTTTPSATPPATTTTTTTTTTSWNVTNLFSGPKESNVFWLENMNPSCP